ncbi:MAG: hypothetical protein GY915_09425 [bacterium]|nr:hypothetical protein [bacterium]
MPQINKQKLEYPGLRANLIWGVKNFTDLDYQKRKWCLDNQKGNVFWDGIREPVNCLFDIPFREYPDKQIGVTIRNWKEIDALIKLGATIDVFYEKSSKGKTNQEYLDSELWQNVIKCAKEAYAILMDDEDIDELLRQEQERTVKSDKKKRGASA